jgi:hypothetical protein
VNDSGQAIEEAAAESSEKIIVIEQLLREPPSIVEQNGPLNDGLTETRSTYIVINKAKHDRYHRGSAEHYSRSTIFFSPQIQRSICIFWENMTYCNKKHPFSTVFKLCFKEIFAQGKKHVEQFLIETAAYGEK